MRLTLSTRKHYKAVEIVLYLQDEVFGQFLAAPLLQA